MPDADRQWACTKRQLAYALAHISLQSVTVAGPYGQIVDAGQLADAILAQLPEMPDGMVLVGREDLDKALRYLTYWVPGIVLEGSAEQVGRLRAAVEAQP